MNVPLRPSSVFYALTRFYITVEIRADEFLRYTIKIVVQKNALQFFFFFCLNRKWNLQSVLLFVITPQRCIRQSRFDLDDYFVFFSQSTRNFIKN